MPASAASMVARPETRNDSATMRSSSGSPETISAPAERNPSRMRSTAPLCARILRLAGVGHEQLLSVLVNAELPDHLLRIRRDHEVRERLAALLVDLWE